MASGPITSWQIDGEIVKDFIFLGSKITADGDCSHEIKRCLLLGRKVMTDLDCILKSRDIVNKGPSSQSYEWMREFYYKESWMLKNLCFWAVVLRVPWTARRFNQSILEEISPSNEYSGLISFRMDWLDLLAVQGTLKSLLQHHSSKASILRCSAFFIVQLSHPYMTTGKTIALTRWTFVDNVSAF